jgi:hypothetical protein
MANRRFYAVLITLVVISTCSVLIAACGSSGGQSSGAATGSAEIPALKLADCMRSHGVPNFPDPSSGGGGVNLTSGVNPQSPAFKSARRACAKLVPGGKPGGSSATESQFLAALSFAKCMRTHGFPAFPDPTHFDSPPGPILIVGRGLYFRVSAQFDPNTPAATRAMARCGEAH